MKSFFVVLASAAMAVAQAVGPLAINDFPIGGVVAGNQYTLTYTAPDQSAPVTFTLKNGPANNLQTYEVLGTATGGTFQWSVSKDLVNNVDWAVQISQGKEVNYMGPFPLTGGAASSASVASTTISSTVSATVTSVRPTITASTYSNFPKNGTATAHGTGTAGTVKPTLSSSTTTQSSTPSDDPAPFEGAASALSVSAASLAGVAAIFGAVAMFA